MFDKRVINNIDNILLISLAVTCDQQSRLGPYCSAPVRRMIALTASFCPSVLSVSTRQPADLKYFLLLQFDTLSQCMTSLSLPYTHWPRWSHLEPLGDAENAGLENAGPWNLRGWKTRDWKTRDQIAGVENAGLENAGPGVEKALIICVTFVYMLNIQSLNKSFLDVI